MDYRGILVLLAQLCFWCIDSQNIGGKKSCLIINAMHNLFTGFNVKKNLQLMRHKYVTYLNGTVPAIHVMYSSNNWQRDLIM